MSSLSAADLYALANGGRNEGDQECHWCSSPAPRIWKHNEPPPLPFTRSTSPARRPSSPYLCFGCWRFSWKRVTLNFLSGGFKDGRCAVDSSILFTEQGVWIVRPGDKEDAAALYPLLLKPPLRFGLMLLEGSHRNNLGLGLVNDFPDGVKAETVLGFTINNIRHDYTPYELEEGLRNGAQGKSPGVQALMRLFGVVQLPPKEGARPEKMERGRPKPLEDGRQLQKMVVAKSGELAIAGK